MKNNSAGLVARGSAYGPRPTATLRRRLPKLSAARAHLLELLADQPEPCTVAALAALSRQHPNTVREHLDGLVASGLAARTRAPAVGRGRPAWLYAATEDETVSASAREYAGLASALAGQLARSSPDPVADALQAGRAWGRELAPEGEVAHSGADARREVVGMLDDLGFAPEADARTAVVRLRRCPLLEAAYEHPEIVCGVHLGLVQGALEQIGGDATAADLEPFAEPGACRLTLLGDPAEQAPPA